MLDREGSLRHQVFLTDTPVAGGDTLQHLEVRHRAHARDKDHIRCGKTTGFGRFPSRHFAINQAWLELSMTASNLLAWTRTLLLDGELATAEPRNSAIVSSTSPPGSPAEPAAYACVSPGPGPGATN